MPAQKTREKRKHSLIRYKPPPLASPPVYGVGVECPLCGHRVFDIPALPKEPLPIGMKCPGCNNIVHFQCAHEACDSS